LFTLTEAVVRREFAKPFQFRSLGLPLGVGNDKAKQRSVERHADFFACLHGDSDGAAATLKLGGAERRHGVSSFVHVMRVVAAINLAKVCSLASIQFRRACRQDLTAVSQALMLSA
jgi:hypothetical protein